MRASRIFKRRSIRSKARRRLRCEFLEKRLLLIAQGELYSLPATSLEAAGILGDVSAQIDWGDGTKESVEIDGKIEPGKIKIRFDYSLDTNSFFTLERRNLLAIAADSMVSRFSDDLAAVNISANSNGSYKIFHPSNGTPFEIPTKTLAANEIVIYAGARDLPDDERGLGAGVNSFRGTQDFVDEIIGRGESGAVGDAGRQTDIAPSFGSITFDNKDTDWYFGADAAGFKNGDVDFLTIASHELAHAIGFGTANSWSNLASGGGFTGAKSKAVHPGGGNVPVDGGHWAASVYPDSPTIMTADLSRQIGTDGQRVLFSALDFAAMDDIGWDVVDTKISIPKLEHTFNSGGTFTPQIVLTGSGQTRLTYPLSAVTVTDSAPTLTAAANTTAIQNVAFTITDIGKITDPGTGGTYTFTIDWGDQTTPDTGTATIDSSTGPTEASFDGTHTYTTTGAKTVTLTVNDGTNEVKKNFQITVDTPPVVVSAAPTDNPDPPPPPKGQLPTTWANQRSDLRVLTFNLPVAVRNPTASDLVFTNLGVNADAEEDKEVALTDSQISIGSDGKTLTLNFPARTLDDGVYQLEVKASLTGGDPFIVTGSEENKLFVLRGDYNGDGAISGGDSGAFSYWYLLETPLPATYINLVGAIGLNVGDFTQFARAFGRQIVFPKTGSGEQISTERIVNLPEAELSPEAAAADWHNEGNREDEHAALDRMYSNQALLNSLF